MCTVSFQYQTVAAVLADMDLMCRNAVQYNGPASPIVADAKALYSAFELALTHTLKQLGPDRDECTLLERAIRKKLAVMSLMYCV